MRKLLTIFIFLTAISYSFCQKKEVNNEVKELQVKIQRMEFENQNLTNNYNNLTTQYQHTNDRLNNYLTYTAIVASIFGVLIALAGIYIGFESLRSQNRRKDAIKTLEEAKSYVDEKKMEFDRIIESKKQLLQDEYENIIKVLKAKLLSDIELETSKVREIAEIKSEEIQKLSVEQQNNRTIELLEKRLEFFENVGIPDDPEILFSKAKILREKKMNKDAIMLFEKLVEKAPEHKEAFWYLGYEYAEMGDNDNSIKNYKRQLELNPKDSSAMNNIALRYKAKGNLLEALENLNKAIELSSKRELYYTNRISVLKKLNSIDKVIADYSQLITINPEKEDYYNELTAVLENEKRDVEAINFYDKAINHFKDKNVEISNNFNFSKASFLGNIGKEQVAIEILQNLIDDNYKIESCYIKIAELKSKLGQTGDAIIILNNGITKNPLSSILYIYKAFVESNVSEKQAKQTIDNGGAAINNESYYFIGGRFFNKNNKFLLSEYCYHGALKIIETKLLNEKIEEVDIMNYYETSIILQKKLNDFESKFRSLIVSEKYRIILTALDILNRLYKNFDREEEVKAILELKSLNIEAKDKDLINWNFDDIYYFIGREKRGDFFKFAEKLIKYLQREISYEEI